MTSVPEELEAAVLALPRAERAHLAKQIIESLETDEDIEQAWCSEVRQRLEAYRNGATSTIGADDVLAEARTRTSG